MRGLNSGIYILHFKIDRTLGLVIIYTIAPIISVVGSLGLAEIAGCDNVNEGSIPTCKIKAVEELVYTGFVAGWFGLITLPTGGPIALILIIALPIHSPIQG